MDRSRSSRPNPRWKALDEIYTFHDLRASSICRNFQNVSRFSTCFPRVCFGVLFFSRRIFFNITRPSVAPGHRHISFKLWRTSCQNFIKTHDFFHQLVILGDEFVFITILEKNNLAIILVAAALWSATHKISSPRIILQEGNREKKM